MIRLILLGSVVEQIERHLQAAAPAEDGCFCVVQQGRGAEGSRFLVTEAILPPADAWEVRRADQLRPSARWVSAAISRAVETHGGLLFVHSHPSRAYPPGLSFIDRSAAASLGDTIGSILDGPFLAVVVHPDGWTGVLVEEGSLNSLDRLDAVSRTLAPLTSKSGEDRSGDEFDDRQRRALGDLHYRLKGLEVAVVGVGGLGSPIAEQLVRVGVGRVLLVDHDTLDTPSNVRRIFGSKASDTHAALPPAKVDVVGAHLEQIGLCQRIDRVHGDVRHEKTFRRLLDVDVVFCATDTHGSRAILNDLASTYLLPVIDVGVRVGSKSDGILASLAAEVRVLTPTTPASGVERRFPATSFELRTCLRRSASGSWRKATSSGGPVHRSPASWRSRSWDRHWRAPRCSRCCPRKAKPSLRGFYSTPSLCSPESMAMRSDALSASAGSNWDWETTDRRPSCRHRDQQRVGRPPGWSVELRSNVQLDEKEEAWSGG